MIVSVSVSHLAGLLKEATELGAMKTLIELGQIKPDMNKSAAIKRVGKANYEQWVMQGLVTPRKDGSGSSVYRIDRIELETARMASNRHGYLTVEQREAIKKPHLGKRG